MKKLILLLTFLTMSLFSYSQQCGTDDSVVQNFGGTNRVNNSTYCINVFFRIVRNDDGSNGYDPNLIPQALANANQYFAPHGITLINAGYNYVNSTALNNYLNPPSIPLVPNAINVFLITNSNDGWAGMAYMADVRTYVTKFALPSGRTLAHEIGHNLNLHHTFRCARNPSCAEHPNGSNCSTAGDIVCDTPSEYDGSDYDYIVAGLPVPPLVYPESQHNPDLTNLMSYRAVRDHFTAGQGNRMRNAIQSAPLLQQIRSNTCAIITGPDRICTTTTTYSLFNFAPGVVVSWSVTPNLQIVSSTATSVTVQIINPIDDPEATITATIGSIVKTKTIHLGVPVLNSFTCGNLGRDFCSGNPIEIESNTLPILDLNDKVTANFAGMTASELNVTTNWEWQTLNNLINLNGYNNQRRIGLLQYGVTGLKVRAKNSCGWSDWYQLDFELVEVPPVWERNASSSIFSVAPNPSNDLIKIKVSKDVQSIDCNRIQANLYNMLNVVKSTVKLVNGEAVIDVKGLEKGTYVLKIKYQDKEESHQIIVN